MPAEGEERERAPSRPRRRTRTSAARYRALTGESRRTWRGTVAFANPIVEPGTRTVKVRIEVANEDYALKPDMFADVVLRRELGDALFVPESEVLKPAGRQLVFLDRGDGRLEPREAVYLVTGRGLR